MYVQGLRPGIVALGTVTRRGRVINPKALKDADVEFEETEDVVKAALSFLVLSGVALSFELHPILISPALRLFMDSINTFKSSWCHTSF